MVCRSRASMSGLWANDVAMAGRAASTPLASLRGYAELFRMGPAQDPVALKRAMARIESEAARMGALVDNLGHWSGGVEFRETKPPPPPKQCTGPMGPVVVYGNLVVPVSCQLAGTKVTGTVTVKPGASDRLPENSNPMPPGAGAPPLRA